MNKRKFWKRHTSILKPIELHCPECFAWTQHYRTVRNHAEVCTCTKCGNVQTYRAREAATAAVGGNGRR